MITAARLKQGVYRKMHLQRFIFLGFIFLGLCLLCSESMAMLPVIDPTEIAKTVDVIEQLRQQYQALQNQYQMLQSQFSMMKQQYQSMTGNYGWGNWHNTVTQLTQQREWTAPSWQSALAGMAGGNPGRYAQLLQEYQEGHSALSQSTYQQGADSNLSASYLNQVQTNEASATTASYEFNDMDSHLQTLYQLGQQIENSNQNTDVKSAEDLNSRVQLEVGYIAMEELRMQTVLNQQMAQAQSANIAQENEASLYNQAGENP